MAFDPRQPPRPNNDVAFWLDLALRTEIAGNVPTAIFYWKAAVAAAKLQIPGAKPEIELAWLSERLARAVAINDMTRSCLAPGAIH